MRKKTLAAALTGALAFSMAGVAYADINNTTFDLSSFSVSPGKSGTTKSPKPVTFKLGVTGGTKDGTGQPSTSTSLKITLPKGLKWNGKAWATGKRCSKGVRSDSECPRGSRIGSGTVDAQALSVTEKITVTAYVLTNGNLGLWLEGTPLPLNTMLEGKVRKQVITVATTRPARKAPVRDTVNNASSDIKKVVTTVSDSIKNALSGGNDDGDTGDAGEGEAQ